jgi:hypothetical protein
LQWIGIFQQAASPATTPTVTTQAPSLTAMRRMSLGCAPIAMRIPI